MTTTMEKMKASMKEKEKVTEKGLGEASKQHNEKQMENPNPWFYFDDLLMEKTAMERTKASMKEKEKVSEKGLGEVSEQPNIGQMEDPDHSFDTLLMEIASMMENMEVTEKGLGEASEQPNEEEMENLNPRNAGQGFTQHVISVAPGEDVGEKINLFLQQSKGAMFIMFASGSISSASLHNPASSRGIISYEGRFEIISLAGSIFINDLGEWIGGLNVCLSNVEGKFIAGGISGPFIAASPVRVIVGTFEPKRDTDVGIKCDISTNEVPPPPIGELVSSVGLCQAVDSSSGNPNQGNEEHQAIGGSHFVIQQAGATMTPSHPLEWGGNLGSSNTSFEVTGRIGLEAPPSLENEDMTN